MTTIKKTSFVDLINLIARTDLWQNAQNGMLIDCSNFCDKTLKEAYLFFKKQGLNLLLFTAPDKKPKSCLYLSEHDFDVWHESVRLFPTQQNFLTDIQLYNPLTNTDWQYLYDHTVLETDTPPTTNKTHFFNKIYETALHSPLACRILNEFILFSKSYHSKESPFFLTIDFTEKADDTLNKNKALGMASIHNNNPYILLKNHAYSSQNTIIKTFFHELRHIVQMCLFLLPSKKNYAFPANNISYVVAHHATEAEAKAYDRLILKDKDPEIQTIFHHHMNQLLKKSTHSTDFKIPYQQGLTPAQKIAATLKFIHIEAYENTVQTLCNCYLSKSKLALYQTLNQQGIFLPPKKFNTLAYDVEFWRTYYFSHNLMPIVNSEQPVIFAYNAQHLESSWHTQTGLKLSLKTTDIFSSPILEQVGLKELIYGPSALIEAPYRFIYQGLEDMPSNVFNLFRDRSYQNIQEIYTALFKKNPILPPIHPNENERFLCYKLVRAIESMQKGKSIQQVLTMLDYNLEDQFTPISFAKNKVPTTLKMQNKIQIKE